VDNLRSSTLVVWLRQDEERNAAAARMKAARHTMERIRIKRLKTAQEGKF